MKPKLVFFVPNVERADLLGHGLESHPRITIRCATPNEPSALAELDAFYVSVMAAERWGSGAQTPVIHEARIFRTTKEDRAEGWPSFVIAGLRLADGEDPFDARSVLPLIIEAVLKAVREFNEQEGEKISSVGFESGWTLIDELPPLDAARIIRATYDMR